jgi:hypothetical protein
VVAVGLSRVRAMLTGSYFDGYNLLLGAMLVVEAVLTLVVGRRSLMSSGAARGGRSRRLNRPAGCDGSRCRDTGRGILREGLVAARRLTVPPQ